MTCLGRVELGCENESEAQTDHCEAERGGQRDLRDRLTGGEVASERHERGQARGRNGAGTLPAGDHLAIDAQAPSCEARAA